jgi:NAD(P) transhydrogenase
MEQGRLATAHMFAARSRHEACLLPYGIYTIPEIAMIGQTDEQLTAATISYETGVARFEELTKAEMVGDRTGMLKLLFHPETLKLLGIHAITVNAMHEGAPKVFEITGRLASAALGKPDGSWREPYT